MNVVAEVESLEWLGQGGQSVRVTPFRDRLPIDEMPVRTKDLGAAGHVQLRGLRRLSEVRQQLNCALQPVLFVSYLYRPCRCGLLLLAVVWNLTTRSRVSNSAWDTQAWCIHTSYSLPLRTVSHLHFSPGGPVFSGGMVAES